MTRFFSEVCLAPDGDGVAPADPAASLAFPGYALPRHRRGRLHRLAAPAHAPRARARRDGLGRFTDYYDPALKEENARGLPVDAARPRRGHARARRRRRRLPPRRAAGRRELRRASSPSTCARTCSRASASSRRPRAAGVRVVFASSSSIYGDAERYPTPEDTIPRPLSPYGITKLACEHLARGVRHGVRARCRHRSATSRSTGRGSGRTWPSRGWSRASPRGAPFELYGDGSQSRSFTYVDDAVEATIAAMERGSAGLDVQRRRRRGGRRCSRRSRCSAGSPGGASRSCGHAAPRGRRGPHGRRHDADPRRARLGAGDVVRGGPRGSVGLGRC